MVCENPNCTPKVECCPCTTGAPVISQPFPFFKETEQNKESEGGLIENNDYEMNTNGRYNTELQTLN